MAMAFGNAMVWKTGTALVSGPPLRFGTSNELFTMSFALLCFKED
jgi:hypothetical protein